MEQQEGEAWVTVVGPLWAKTGIEWNEMRSLVLGDLSCSFDKRRKRAEGFAQFKERML